MTEVNVMGRDEAEGPLVHLLRRESLSGGGGQQS